MTRKILLNPGPATTTQNVKDALVVDDICPRESEFGDLMHEICNGLLEIGKGQNDYNVALFGASGTGAMEATLTSAIGAKGKVLILTNGAYGIRMTQICDNYGIDYDTLFVYGDFTEPAQVKKALATGKYSHLAFIHHETSTGMLDPVEELVDICKALNVVSIVDAMSTFGAFPYNLSELGVDYIFSSSNKCIHGMAGLSFVIFHNDRKDELKANGRSYYFDVYKQWENVQKKSQLRFTPPVQICYSFMAAIKETLAEGVEARWERYKGNWQILYDGLLDLGFKPLLPLDQESKILLALKLDGKDGFDFDDFHDFLYERDITIYPGVMPEMATFRVAIIGDLYPEDMHRVMEEMTGYFN
ncbi:MAG: 2-aminoethylphosphonate aminotransferase [Reichenbachiella sp.]|uniref:2-aminoethylphosphonate aminotransferase n=1 Tax=Reichenbachiella sp. TaxID=2184521 RepID=UPI003263C300